MPRLIEQLKQAVGPQSVLSEPGELLVYECDGLPQHKFPPRAVVFPASTEEVAAAIRVLAAEKVPLAPRGAGTGLSGGAIALNRGVVIEMAKMRRLLELDDANRIARVETGFVNSAVSRAVAKFGLYYAPDPSSQASCTIGGNIAENAGGIHCLKYGTTVDHILSARVVLPDGSIVDLLSPEDGAAGLDLLGVFVGSEGTFGIATEATLRLTQNPASVRTLLADFLEVDAASRAVSKIISEGLLPAALEMIDGEIIRAVEASVFAAGMPTDAEAALLIELDGIEAGLASDVERAEQICKESGARSVRIAKDEAERKKLWAARKGAFGAMGRISPDLMLQDAVVPRSKLPEVLRAAFRIGAKYNLLVANVFHAGDGNLHPFICYDSRIPGEVERVTAAGRELIETCVAAGGSITGEHGVGFDKRDYLPLIFAPADLDAMLRVRAAFDPDGLFNPGKIIPMPLGCGEGRLFSTSTLAATVSNGDTNGAENSRSEDILGDFVQEAAARMGIARVHASTFDQQSCARDLERLVGPKNVSVDTRVTVCPANLEEAREILLWAAKSQWPVMPAGAETWLGSGLKVGQGLIVKTTRMNRMLRHEAADLIATAEAGLTLMSFNQSLARSANQWLPLDPPDDGRSTLGGVVATGIGGPQSHAYRFPRSSVIGIHVLLAEGHVIKGGGIVVKNVAGYDLCKLFTGSYGTLGLILDITFKLRPLPVRQKTVIAHGTIVELCDAANRIAAANLNPVAVELLSPAAARELDVSCKEQLPGLLIRFAGNSQSVEFQATASLKLISESVPENRAWHTDDESQIWRGLSSLPLRFAGSAIWRTKMRPQSLRRCLTESRDGTCGLSDTIWHAGLGSGCLRVINTEAQEFSSEKIAELRKDVKRFNGTLIVEDGIPTLSAGDTWGAMPNLGLMKRVKKQLDPQELLSPGRFWDESL